jgi:hypothetical protein
MKGQFLTVFLYAVIVFTLPAQEYNKWLGGTVSLSGQSNGQRQSNFTLMPEFGIHLNDAWAAGIMAGFSTSKTVQDPLTRTENHITVIPFARYTFGNIAGFNLFGQGELPLNFTSGKNYDGSSMDGTTSVGVRIRPGISYYFNQRWGFNMLMPPVISISSTDGSSSYRLGFNDGYTIQGYLLSTSIGFIYMF